MPSNRKINFVFMNFFLMSAVLLDRSFYARCPKIVARELLGKVIVSTIERRRSAGIVVETEAYLASADTACHGFAGQTRKNSSMFGPCGHAYVYPIHARYCFNTVTETEGRPSAVLIRALEPLEGISTMRSRRAKMVNTELCSGPAKLCQALGIDQNTDGIDLTRRRKVWLLDKYCESEPFKVKTTVRIGVTSAHDMKLRYVVAGSCFASGPKRMR